MIRVSPKSICLFFTMILFLLLSLPPRYIDPLRARLMQVIGVWLPSYMPRDNTIAMQHLELENGQLKERVFDLEQIVKSMDATSPLLAAHVGAKLAKVVYRAPSFWDSSCWVRAAPQKGMLAKNSPVVLGTTLIGIIDLETPDQSRVRLITDPQMVVSVRAMRDGIPLAKGELCGCLHPSNRTRGITLSGVGFHYDFADEEGPARDLRTGQPTGHPDSPFMPLLAVGDRLVTTGMDGLFPKGLDVAEVTSISPLQEGDYFYDLEAKSLAKSLDALNFVFVLLPLDVKRELE